MKKIKIFDINFILGIGLIYYNDKYNKHIHGLNGIKHYLIIGFIKLTWGYLILHDINQYD